MTKVNNKRVGDIEKKKLNIYSIDEQLARYKDIQVGLFWFRISNISNYKPVTRVHLGVWLRHLEEASYFFFFSDGRTGLLMFWRRLRRQAKESHSVCNRFTSHSTFVLPRAKCSTFSFNSLFSNLSFFSSFSLESFWITMLTSSGSSWCFVLICLQRVASL